MLPLDDFLKVSIRDVVFSKDLLQKETYVDNEWQLRQVFLWTQHLVCLLKASATAGSEGSRTCFISYSNFCKKVSLPKFQPFGNGV